MVVTDASRCQQIFGNLVSNALKYTPVGGRVRVTGRAEADSWSVIVSDSGPGIPAESLDRVFEPFFRLSRDEHSVIEGSGLGLAICRELVDATPGRNHPRLGRGDRHLDLRPFPRRGTGEQPATRRQPLAQLAMASANLNAESSELSATGSHRGCAALEGVVVEVVVRTLGRLCSFVLRSVARSSAGSPSSIGDTESLGASRDLGERRSPSPWPRPVGGSSSLGA